MSRNWGGGVENGTIREGKGRQKGASDSYYFEGKTRIFGGRGKSY